ncbi:MAG TPA: CHAT domain-containing protein, partial [Steroidobacteraceae bacterium]|nr:CHAT domain-containing protein [Steroidobacteraceae bacterium]
VANRPGLPVSPEQVLLAFEEADTFAGSTLATGAAAAAALDFSQGKFRSAAEGWGSVANAADATPAARSDSLRGFAQARQASGQFAASLAPLDEALTIARGMQDSARMAAALGGLANAQLALGESEVAEEHVNAALALVRNGKLRAMLLNNRGNLLVAKGRLQPALESYTESAAVARQANAHDYEAYALANAAAVEATLGREARAYERIQAANATLRTLDPSYAAVSARINLGIRAERLASRSHGQASRALLEAHASFSSARELAVRLADRRSLAFALGGLSRLYQSENRLDEAEGLARLALANAEAAEEDASLYRWHWQLAQIYWARGATQNALDSYLRAMTLVDAARQEARASYGSNDQVFRTSVMPVYQGLVAALLSSSDRVSDDATKSKLLFQARDVVERLKAAELRDYFHDECVAELNAQAVPLEQISNDTAIVYPILLPDRLEILVSSSAVVRRYTVHRSRDDITHLVRQFRRHLENRTTREYLPLAQELYQVLVAPFVKDLESSHVDTLVFIPDGVLYEIPMTALHDGNHFLAERFAIAVTPMLRLVAPQPLHATQLNVLLAGVSTPAGQFSALPFVAEEIRGIQSIIGGTVFLDDRFDTAAFRKYVTERQPNVIHVASHAVFGGTADSSFLVTHDGRLTMNELQQLVAQTRFRKPLELLTLSACQTAEGDERAALGLSGTAIRAGARSVLGSLWTVSDEATGEILVEFYRALGEPGTSKVHALQQAQRKLISDPRFAHPYYWSAFTLISNWL